MIFLVSILLGLGLGILGQKFIKKFDKAIYIVTILISVAVIYATKVGIGSEFTSTIMKDWIWPMFSRGALATALFVIVMYTGALPNGSWLIKKLMPIRAELSIIATILTLGHNISFGFTYFKMLFTTPEILPVNQLLATICTIVMMIIMIPLCITSFKSVRKKMDPKSWKKLQRWAYVFYALIYIHVMILVIPLAKSGREGYMAIITAYSIIFLGYAAMRLYKALKGKKIAVRSVPVVVSMLIAVLICVYSAPGSVASGNDKIAEKEKSKTEQQSEDDKASGEEEAPSDDNASDKEAPDANKDDMADNGTTDAEKKEDKKNEQADKKGDKAQEQPQQPKVDHKPKAAPSQPQKPAPPQPPAVTKKYKDGSFTGSARGYVGNITVRVSISNDTIRSVTVISQNEDEPYWSSAKAVLGKIVAAQSADVSTVSGATFSSRGIINAARSAINQARN